MSRSLRRGALAASAIAFSIASLAACGAGNDAQTLAITPDNAFVTKGDIKVQNALVITQGAKDAKGPAVVSATVFNGGAKPQTLDAVTLAGAKGKITLKDATGAAKVTVPAHGSVVLGGKGNATAVIEGGRQAVKDGDSQKIVFQLSQAGDVELAASVVPATGYYAGFGPTEAPAAGPTPSVGASPSPSGPGGATTSGSPSSTAPGSVSGSPTAPAAPAASASHSAGH
ncbi:DUF461 domain-containing protein [Streptomyces sp. G-G2]|uniref:DUF461 domain-containing protein n=1 Tax=Streptomyces sp. G-G2 TaxID=3046201 RepID=UPI0024B903EF|nr:DUF461 domain-containing protein [Streptomyces sp. G-G2]MDJ0384048.1 DUF461 domain-containing protein [Streptomyces sp. G-G2]